MRLYKANSDSSYELIKDESNVGLPDSHKVIIYLNKELLNMHGYFIYDKEYYIDIDFDFYEMDTIILLHINKIKAILRDKKIDNFLK